MRTTAALAAIIAIGLGVRLAEAWDGRPPVYDAAAYAAIAANLERGEGFQLGPAGTQPASNYSPGLPLLVAGLYEASGGADKRFARVVLALIGSLAVLFAYLIGRRLAGPVAGLVGAAGVAVYPALVEYQGMVMGEPLGATLLSGAILAMLWVAGPANPARGSCRGGGVSGRRWVFRLRGGRPSEEVVGAKKRTPLPPDTPPPRHPREEWRWLAPGLLLGALALVRPEYLVASMLLALVVLARDWGRAGIVNAVVLLVGVVLVVAPWTVRNAVVLDRFVPVSTGGGQVLFAGSYLPSGGDPERVGEEVLERHPELRGELPRDARLEEILAALAAQRYPRVETDRALARMGRERLGDAVTQQPLEYAGFVAAKVWRIWSHGPREVMREPPWAALHWALAGLGLLGLAVLARRRRWEALLLGTVLLAATASGALLVASPRRLLVAVPLLAALAGVAVTGARDSLARRWNG